MQGLRGRPLAFIGTHIEIIWAFGLRVDKLVMYTSGCPAQHTCYCVLNTALRSILLAPLDRLVDGVVGGIVVGGLVSVTVSSNDAGGLVTGAGAG